MKRLATILALLLPLTARAAYDPAFGDDIDRTADDFVTVSLVVADPGAVLYSRLGHAALHMQCPSFELDYVFSYESEDTENRFFSFMAGKLKMGMYAIPMNDYLEGYRNDGRGVREYKLNLPPAAKSELWRILDISLEKGVNLEYDYIKRGCAQSTLQFLIAGLKAAGFKFEYGPWPEHFKGATRGEIARHFLKNDKWACLMLSFLTNGIINDTSCSNVQKVIIPSDLVLVLQNAKVDDVEVIDTEPKEILNGDGNLQAFPVSPSMLVLLLMVLWILFRLHGCYVMDYILLGIQTVLGTAIVYMVFFSSLVCTEWSWLIIPFNPLPLIFWKWRRWWQLPYCGVLLVWCGFMIFWPHQLTDPAYIILTFTLALSYAPNSVKTIKK